MVSITVYCKDHRRQPVRFGYPSVFRDRQADIPAGWCCLCGSEVYVRGEDRCIRCRNRKGAREE